jgi:hypothetical protein
MNNLAVNGGAISVDCNYMEPWHNEITYNYFEDNNATVDGGAIIYNSFRPIMTDNVFVNNSAGNYANETASFPVKIMQIKNGQLSYITELTDVPSGQAIETPVTFAIVDEDEVIMVI